MKFDKEDAVLIALHSIQSLLLETVVTYMKDIGPGSDKKNPEVQSDISKFVAEFQYKLGLIQHRFNQHRNLEKSTGRIGNG